MDRQLLPGRYAYCSLGFAVKTAAGDLAALTANHCGPHGWRTPLGDLLVGISQQGRIDKDATIVIGASYQGVTYVGAYRDDPDSESVVGAADPDLDELVVTSGGASGAWSTRVRDVDLTVNYPGIGQVYPVFRTRPDIAASTAGEGDSGGPTYAYVTGGVAARGLISGGDGNDVPCQGVQGFNGVVRECTVNALSVNIMAILGALSADIDDPGTPFDKD